MLPPEIISAAWPGGGGGMGTHQSWFRRSYAAEAAKPIIRGFYSRKLPFFVYFTDEMGENIYTQQKKKVDTYSTLIISYTNWIDGKCHISYEREIPLYKKNCKWWPGNSRVTEHIH